MVYVIRIIPATILLFKIVFASIFSCFKLCKTRAIKTSKAKDVVGNDKKVILRKKYFENYMNDKGCCLNIVIDPKVANTTFKFR